MDILYKFVVEDNIEKIKENVLPKNIRDDLYQLHLIDENQHVNFQKVSNEECLNILLKNLSLFDSGGQKYKQFVENVIQKNYDYFYKELHTTIENNDWIQNKYKTILNYGDFPRKPAHYVDRFDKITQIQDCLRKLPTVGKVILCGMTGSGKTSLVMGIMTREMVLEVFAGKVFWITVGDADDEQLLMLLSKFYLKLTTDTQENNNTLFSSKDILKVKLKKKIRENINDSQMLLVLDNVCSETAIQAFDIGCRVLITTQKKDLWKNDSDTQLIEIDGSFKIDETCALFAKCLDMPIGYVQKIREVGKIHKLCRGHPFSIALFGSQIATFKEKLLDSDSRKWHYFIEMLQKNYSNQQNTVISSCIETLDEDIRNRYSDFAIFPDDVNISSKVLEIMWGLDEFQVREIMGQLENKSLIVSYYSNDQHNYIFGIHVVLLSYLKNKYKNELKEKHVRLISAYKKDCKDDFSRLTNDNYIYQYIGYHLKHADSVKDFKIYFDLKFIGAKIKATGIGDILKDFNIYRKEIEEQTIINSKNIVADIESFIKKFGDDLHKHEDISIIQCALQCNKDSFIYKTALQIAYTSNSSLYFKIQIPPKNCDSHVDEFQLPENCTFVCFARPDNQLLIGTKEGVIELWDRIYQKLIQKYVGHTQSIRYIELDPDGTTFLSVSEDGHVKLWRFPSRMDLTPSLVQSNHIILFGEEQSIAPIHTFTPEENDHFTSGSFSNNDPRDQSIVLGSNKGKVYLRGKEDQKLLHLKKELPIKMLKFSDDDSLIIGICGNELFLLTKNLQQFIFEPVRDPVTALRIVDEDSFITLSKQSVSLWSFTSRRMPKDKLPDIEEVVIDTAMADQEFSCAFSNNNNTLLYVLTTDHKVNVYDIEKLVRCESITTSDSDKNDYVTAVDVYPSDNPMETLFLLKFKNNVLKFYTPKTLKQSRRKHKPIFDCYWTETQARFSNITSKNTIQISNNFNILNDLDNLENTVTAVCFSPCGDSIAYGLENGQVAEYEIKTNHKNYVLKLPSAVSQLKYFAKKSILVASSKRGDLIVRSNGRNVCLIVHSEITRHPPEPLVEIFYVDGWSSLLTVSKDRVIKIWHLIDGNMKVLKGPKYFNVTHTVQMCAMSRNGCFLALTMSNMFDLFLVDKECGEVNLIDAGGAEMEHELYSCCFSCNNQYLAFGTIDGCIIVYQINLGRNIFHEYAKLYSHMSVVKCLRFSPHNSNLLVSVGEQIVWWNLNKIPKHCLTRNRRSRRSRPQSTESLSQIENLTISHTINNKIGSDDKPHLLRAIKLKGSYANTIFASPNFKTFVTKDDEEVCYIMEMIE